MALQIFKYCTPPSMKGFNLPTLLTQVSESTSVKGETPLTFPVMYPLEGDFIQCAAALCKGKVARLPSTPGSGCKPANLLWPSSGCTHEIKVRPSLKKPRDILLALSIFVPFKAIYGTIASHQFGKKQTSFTMFLCPKQISFFN